MASRHPGLKSSVWSSPTAQILSHFYKLLLAAAIVLLFFTHIPVWLGRVTGSVVAPLVYLGMMLSVIPFAISENVRITKFLAYPYTKWCFFTFAVFALTVVRLIFLREDVNVADTAHMIDQTQKLSLLFVFAYLCYTIPSRYFVPFFAVLCLVAPISLIIDFFYQDVLTPFDSSLRAGAFWVNPNVAGEAVILSLVLAGPRIPRPIFAVGFLLAGVALVFTGSRSAMFGWLLIGGYFIYRERLPRSFLLVPVLVTLFYSVIISSLGDFITSSSGNASEANNFLARFGFVAGQVDSETGAESTRSGLVVRAFEEALQKPILGHGYEYQDTVEVGAGPHNEILALWHFYGVFGLAIWGALAYLLYRRSSTPGLLNPGFLCFIWFSFFSHNILDGNHWLIFLSFLLFENYKRDASPVANEFIFDEDRPQTKRRPKKRKRRRRGSPSG